MTTITDTAERYLRDVPAPGPVIGDRVDQGCNFDCVNRSELAEAAERGGIRPEAYSLVGGLPTEAYVLDLVEGGWTVYYSERGKRRDEVRFDTEHEACDYLLLKLVGDPTTRR